MSRATTLDVLNRRCAVAAWTFVAKVEFPSAISDALCGNRVFASSSILLDAAQRVLDCSHVAEWFHCRLRHSQGQLVRRGGGFLLGLRDHVLGDEFGLETDDGVRIGDDGLCVVLCFVAGASWLSGNDERAFA
jgi:hypothetical protein